MLMICARNVAEARQYCKDNGLVQGNTFIVDHRGGLYGRRSGVLRLVGNFHARPDAEDIAGLAQRNGVTVEDRTQ